MPKCGLSFCATICFNIWRATRSLLRSGSLTSRCTLAGVPNKCFFSRLLGWLFGHDNVAFHIQPIPTADIFQSLLEDSTGVRRGEKRLSVVTAEGDEVQVSSVLVTLQTPRHAWSLGAPCGSRRDAAHSSAPILPLKREGWGTRAFGLKPQMKLKGRATRPTPGAPG